MHDFASAMDNQIGNSSGADLGTGDVEDYPSSTLAELVL